MVEHRPYGGPHEGARVVVVGEQDAEEAKFPDRGKAPVLPSATSVSRQRMASLVRLADVFQTVDRASGTDGDGAPQYRSQFVGHTARPDPRGPARAEPFAVPGRKRSGPQ